MKRIIYYVFSLLDSRGMRKKALDISECSKVDRNTLLGKKVKWLIAITIVAIILSFLNVFYIQSNITQILIYVVGIIGFVLLYQIYILTEDRNL